MPPSERLNYNHEIESIPQDYGVRIMKIIKTPDGNKVRGIVYPDGSASFSSVDPSKHINIKMSGLFDPSVSGPVTTHFDVLSLIDILHELGLIAPKSPGKTCTDVITTTTTIGTDGTVSSTQKVEHKCTST